MSSKWETSLQSNGVSHWLGTNLESALKDPTFTKYMTTSWHGNAFHITGLLWRSRSIGHWWIPFTMGTVMQNCYFFYFFVCLNKLFKCKNFDAFFLLAEQAVEKAVKLPVVSDSMTFIWNRCNGTGSSCLLTSVSMMSKWWHLWSKSISSPLMSNNHDAHYDFITNK